MFPLIAKFRAFFVGKEPLVFVAALMVVLGILAFVFLLDEVREGGTKNFDNRVLRALRKPDDPSKLIGPRWVGSVGRDVTACGGGPDPIGVLAGWAVGLVWALLCWLVARYLQRRGAIEREEDPTLPERKAS